MFGDLKKNWFYTNRMRFRKKSKSHYLCKVIKVTDKLNFLIEFKNHKTLGTYTKRQFEELLFEHCLGWLFFKNIENISNFCIAK